MKFLQLLFLATLVSTIPCFAQTDLESKFIKYIVDPKKQDLRFFYKDEKNQAYRSIQQLKTSLERKGEKLLFAMNGGMYMEGNIPLGLYIEKGKSIRPLNTRSATGNFYMKPNGVFYITSDGKAFITTTPTYKYSSSIQFATQSGPMLLIEGKIHPDFNEKSSNINIRNGVGILPNGNVLFVLSKSFVTFYEMASYFKTLGCKNALYLDGAVSRMYLPSANWADTDGDFGVIIGEVQKK